ncbi:MAG: DNA polymerase III subunit delta' [Candidatus Omnitrophota bacterium]
MITETNIAYSPVVKRFAEFIKNKRLAHAYLFIGPASSGKTITAFTIAKLVNCENPKAGAPCEACASCVKIANGNHPDVHFVSSEDNTSIKIEQIRDMINKIQLRPFEAEKKVFIIKNAEQLTLEAANALLKTLEEPSANSLIILTTASSEKNLDTIKSRCQIIHFSLSTPKDLEEHLCKRAGLDKQSAHFLAYFTEGSLGKANRMDSQMILKQKNAIIDFFLDPESSPNDLRLILSDKEKTKEALKVVLTWFRDILFIKMGIAQIRLINTDRLDDLKRLVSVYSVEELNIILQEFSKMIELSEDNFNIKIALAITKERLCPRS